MTWEQLPTSPQPESVEGPFDRAPRARVEGAPPARCRWQASLDGRRIEIVPLAEVDSSDQTFQYRFDARFEDLKRSLASEGQREPVDLLEARPYRIIDGFRRVAALRSLGSPTVSALVHSGMCEKDAHALAFVKNVVRRNLTPIERAHAIAKARKEGVTLEELATRLHLSSKQAARYEALVSFPPGVQDLLERGTISMAHAKVLADVAPEDPHAWAARARQGSWSATDLKRELRRALGGKPPGRKPSYVRREGNVLRVYPFRVSRDAPREQREHIVALLRQAIAFLDSP
jgi:ParB family chromosome partitioning protein